tara:strand:+ start:91 stop:681 length:591 start_codon:yes stop_codon:yes gene_type:complete
MKLKAIFCIGMFALSSFSFSNEKSIEECAKIEDPTLRLKCYDSFLLSSAPQEKKESAPSMEKAENYYKPPPNKIIIEPIQSAEPSQELKQAQIKIQETESELKKVKSELKKAQEIEKQLRKEDKDVLGTIVSVRKTGNYKIDITLDNGQVWRSVESVYNRLPVKKSQKVIISKALVSGHILKVTGKKVAIRVRKIS